ncbi:MAG: universal stress protein [Desulfovibrio sp.]|jgi:nucleotide-binding universal stress UspA family protein|nr:universal stress protein [Desulfovibrio sp.]
MRDIKVILCALDLSQHSALVAEHAVMLARAFSAEVVAVYAAPALTQYVGFHVPPSSIENFVGEIVSGAEQSMKEFVAEHFSSVMASGKVVNGYAAEEILNAAEEYKADIIVMGTHGRKGIDRILFGSVAEKIVKSSPIPVMTVRPAD